MDIHVDTGRLQSLQVATDTPGVEGFQAQFIYQVVPDFFQCFSISNSFKDLQNLVLANQLFITSHDALPGNLVGADNLDGTCWLNGTQGGNPGPPIQLSGKTVIL